MFKNLDPTPLGVGGYQSEVLELALSYGFRGIDLDMVEFAGRVKLHGMDYARRLLTSANVRVGTFRLPVDCDAENGAFQRQLASLAESARTAAELGCTRTVYSITPAGDTRPYHENFELHKRRFGEICGVLEPAGVRLAVGIRAAEGLRKGRAFQFIHDLDALLLLLNMVGAANIGLLIDVWNLWLAGASIETLRGLAPRQIVALQLADLPADLAATEIDETQRLLPGASGRVDAAAVLQVLAEAGYDGPVTIKADRTAFESARRDRMVKQVGDVLERLWKAAQLTPDGKRAVPVAK